MLPCGPTHGAVAPQPARPGDLCLAELPPPRPSSDARRQLLCQLLPTLTELHPATLLRTDETVSSAETRVRFINILPDRHPAVFCTVSIVSLGS